MEHHTYAKSGSKKWSVEEKRLLVTKRIEAEDLFSKCSSKQGEPWKKFKDMAKIGDYSERALRKQWLNMVQRYRVQKSNMQVTPLNKQCIEVLNEEWEFFGQIHAYMNQKTADLHSYALKEPNVQEQPLSHSHSHSNSQHTQSQSQAQSQAQSQSPNHLAIRGMVNDHSFGTCKPHSPGQVKVEVQMEDSLEEDLQSEEQLPRNGRYSRLDIYTDSDSEESSQPSDPVAVDLSEADSLMASPLPAKLPSDIGESITVDQMPTAFETASGSMDHGSESASLIGQKPIGRSGHRKRKALSEKDKYYRHRRRYEHRMEQRLGGLCKFAGQLLEHLVPGMNVTPLLTKIYNSVDYTCNSSCEEEDDNDHDDDDEDDSEEDNNQQ